MITQAFDLNLIPGGVKPVVKASQYDAGSRTLSISLFAGMSAFPVPTGAVVMIQGTKQDGTGFQYECTFAGNVVTAEVAQQMTVFAGPVEVELQILSGGEVLGTGNFILQVEQAALADDTIISETDIPIIQRIPEYVAEAQEAVADAQAAAEEAAEVSKNLWYPTVNTDGDISWQKSTSETAPATQNIKGPQGETGPVGPTGATGKGIASVTKIGSSGLIDTYRITYTDGTTFDYTVTNGSTYTEGDGINISNNEISVDTTFTEASTRVNIASGDLLATIWGKIKKFFTDLKTVAFSGAYSDLSGTENVAVKNANNNFTENQRIDKKNGTASTVANSMFSVGNNIPQGTDKNSRGIIGIFSNTAKIALLWAATDLASDINLYLPSKGGTLALEPTTVTTITKLTPAVPNGGVTTKIGEFTLPAGKWLIWLRGYSPVEGASNNIINQTTVINIEDIGRTPLAYWFNLFGYKEVSSSTTFNVNVTNWESAATSAAGTNYSLTAIEIG